MRLTKSTIQQYIKEELQKVLLEQGRTPQDIQKDLDHAIKTYNFWGTKDKNSQEFKNADAAIKKFRKEKQEAQTRASKEPSGAPAGGWGDRSPQNVQKDLDHAIKTYNFWGTKDKNSQEFKNAAAAVKKFRNEKAGMAGQIATRKKSGSVTQSEYDRMHGPGAAQKAQDADIAAGGDGWAKGQGPCGDGTQIGTNPDGSPICSGGEPQTQSMRNEPKPERFEGMSTPYLEKRGRKWNPQTGDFEHATKGPSLKDFVAKYRRGKKGRKKKEYPTSGPKGGLAASGAERARREGRTAVVQNERNKLEVAKIKELDGKIGEAFRLINTKEDQGDKETARAVRKQVKKLQRQKRRLVRKANSK